MFLNPYKPYCTNKILLKARYKVRVSSKIGLYNFVSIRVGNTTQALRLQLHLVDSHSLQYYGDSQIFQGLGERLNTDI